mmetsp:Transcript_21655/g.49883  ORF Transcript_21655/g.49883 Transcript_21655/m.49883 type:complete len:228 (-) Transcript_21655:75-758(-)|eukprot:CAMPEP_0119541958 /NCGR_PEP_ID=MMETSP1344-20130328/53285_1 /TAXON_ID=236787 /ORGANISM="Florenciella parvula, Strain CCMP2471" /LENGTH=227 /DNA_ID=CAMNT_0007586073 /DNA_START=129 /DNA_END=812 /DNA_ORIENTATION=-
MPLRATAAVLFAMAAGTLASNPTLDEATNAAQASAPGALHQAGTQNLWADYDPSGYSQESDHESCPACDGLEEAKCLEALEFSVYNALSADARQQLLFRVFNNTVDEYCSVLYEQVQGVGIKVRVKNCPEVLETTFKGLNNHVRLHYLRAECSFVGTHHETGMVDAQEEELSSVLQYDSASFTNLDQSAHASSGFVATGLMCVGAVVGVMGYNKYAQDRKRLRYMPL